MKALMTDTGEVVNIDGWQEVTVQYENTGNYENVHLHELSKIDNVESYYDEYHNPEINGWITRDKSGTVCFHTEEPFFRKDVWKSDEYLILSRHSFPNLTFENSPQQISFSPKYKDITDVSKTINIMAEELAKDECENFPFRIGYEPDEIQPYIKKFLKRYLNHLLENFEIIPKIKNNFKIGDVVCLKHDNKQIGSIVEIKENGSNILTAVIDFGKYTASYYIDELILVKKVNPK